MRHRHPGTFERLELAREEHAPHDQKSPDRTQNLRRKDLGSEKRKAWFRDQYRHPHESKHTIGEVIRWLETMGFQFVKSIPPSKPFEPVSETETLFDPGERGNRLERFIAELGMTFRGSREGGFFVVIARKIASPN